MCGRYTITTPPLKMAQWFHAELPAEPQSPRFNAAPTQRLPVLLNESPRAITLLRWGLIPSWAKDPSIGNRMINARAETLREKPSFRAALKKRRCLVLADGFYEWKKTPEGKTPMRIALRSGAPFAFAGLWETWRDPASHEPRRTFTIITTTPNELMADIHNRMPAILAAEEQDAWLSEASSTDDWLRLLRPYPAERMEAYAVSRRANAPAHDDPGLIDRAASS